jgi:peptidoglycan/xylan/chitin deacetylase (PgdA/CDA1 family)
MSSKQPVFAVAGCNGNAKVIMIGKRGVRFGSCIASGLGMLACFVAQGAAAAECQGHPDAIGTSRTLVVDPREHPRIGAMQYPESLPLRDHEVVLTFDDGPVPRNSNQVLQILADQCVKAIFFTIGSQAQANPEGVRKLAAAGHTIGTHSQNHPLTFNKMSLEQAKREVDQGIASTLAALNGDSSALAPFFRVPGLLRGEGVEEYAASQGLQVWSADFLADDWRHISSATVDQLAVKRVEARGKGILLLHDIQARTVAALPKILQELKVRGYQIVQVVPATADRPATPTEPQDWQLHPILETVPIAHWPKVPELDLAGAVTRPDPTLADFVAPDENLALSGAAVGGERRSAHGVPIPREAPWPRQTDQIELSLQNTAPALPVPEASLFQIAEKAHAPTRPLDLVAHHLAQTEQGAPETTSSIAHSSRATHPATTARTWRGHHVGRLPHQAAHVGFDKGTSDQEISAGAMENPSIKLARR